MKEVLQKFIAESGFCSRRRAEEMIKQGKVFVNGKSGGYIYHQPWECDVTELIKDGKNNVEVVVIGTLKNTLGPHHGEKRLGLAWPSMFHKAPKYDQPAGDEYHTVGYGLFEPFELRNVHTAK